MAWIITVYIASLISIIVAGASVVFGALFMVLERVDYHRWNRRGIAALLIGVLVLPPAIIGTVRSNWAWSREECRRAARLYQTAYRWDRLIGCYLQDDSGRFIPETAYLTTRTEGSR